MRKLAILACFILTAAIIAFADEFPELDPATLHVGPGYGTACAAGGCPTYLNKEVNGIGSTTIDIYQNSGGAPNLVDPILLILGVANDTSGGTALSAGSIVGSASLIQGGVSTPVSTEFGFAANTFNLSGGGGGYQGLYTSTSTCNGSTCNDVYQFLNLTGNASNNFGNWAAADLAVNGITATNFGIYVFALHTDQFNAGDYLNITFANGALPIGTFAIGYGQTPNLTQATALSGDGKVYGTPFTEAGLTTSNPPPPPVPEPASLVLLGSGICGAWRWARRRVK